MVETKVIHGDALEVCETFSDNSIQTVVTSPPYWGQRDYGFDDQIGVEEQASQYVTEISELFKEIARILHPKGSVWLNLGDTYNGCSIIRQANESHHPRKGEDEYEAQLSENRSSSGVIRRSSSQFGLQRQSRMLIPSRIARNLCEDGPYRLRDEVVWVKPSPKPEGRVSTRLRQSHERIYRFVISESAIFDDTHDVSTNVWEIPTADNIDHPAPFPRELPKRCIELTSEMGDTVLDPFCGSGTTLSVAEDLGRSAIGVDANERFVQQTRSRLRGDEKKDVESDAEKPDWW